jgi:hypothetical protein
MAPPSGLLGAWLCYRSASRIVRYASHDLALSQIIACINPEKARSISVATRLGFLRAGRKMAYGTEFDLYRLGSAMFEKGYVC